MPAHSIPDHVKRLRGTSPFHGATETTVTAGLVAVVEPLPPPRGLTVREREMWKLHMLAMIEAGTLSRAGLLPFLAMVQVAASRGEALEAANAEGPSQRDEKGGTKASPAYKAFCAMDGRYASWCVMFGLVPSAAKTVQRLPRPRPGLALVEAGG